MTTDHGSAPRHEGGPLERVHIKELVQRNTLESVVFSQKARNIETAKKAFVRQTTRDESEMKTLLLRLQHEQTTTAGDIDSDISSDSYDVSDHEDNELVEDSFQQLSNPYPVTIIPRFSTGRNTKPAAKGPTKAISHDINESDDWGPSNPGTPRLSLVTEPTTSTPRSDSNAEWLGTPNAISSVRRARKSIAEQMHTKMSSRSLNDANWGLECCVSSGPPSEAGSPVSHSRSNSLKEKKSRNRDISPRNTNIGKRGGSLKERKNSYGVIPTPNQRLMRVARSYTTLTKTSLTEFDDLKAEERIKRHNSWKEFNQKVPAKCESETPTKPRSRQNSLKEKRNRENVSDAKSVLQRKDSRKQEKQALSRKSSNEGTAHVQPAIPLADPPGGDQNRLHPEQRYTRALDENSQRTTLSHNKKQAYRPTSKSFGQSTSNSPHNSPNISPLVRETQVFKY